MNRIGKTARRALAGVAVAGLASAGAALIMAGSAGAALATTPGTCVGSDASCTTVATVQVGTTLTIADNSPTISFGGVNVAAGSTQTATVNYMVSSNDTAGANVNVAVQGSGGNNCFFVGTNNANQISDATALTLEPSGGVTFNPGTSCGSGGENYASEVIPHAGVNNQAYTDTWQLVIPGNTVADTYTATMFYTLLGN